MTDAQDLVADAAPLAVEKILLAAEAEFAERGFEGAGMKAISVRASVSQALLHYHFGRKDHLYAEVVRHRSKIINDARLALLNKVDLSEPDACAAVLDALFRPPLSPNGGERPYARIFAGLVVGRERDEALVREHYDATARKFIDALKKAVPNSDQATAAMFYTLSLGALVAVIGRTGRVERLMNRDTQMDTEEILRSLIAFAQGGIFGLVGSARDK